MGYTSVMKTSQFSVPVMLTRSFATAFVLVGLWAAPLSVQAASDTTTPRTTLESLAAQLADLQAQVELLKQHLSRLDTPSAGQFTADDITAVTVRNYERSRPARTQYEITFENGWRLMVNERSDDRLGEFHEKLQRFGYTGTMREFRERVEELN